MARSAGLAIPSYFKDDSDIDCQIRYSTYKGHAIALTKEAIANGADIVVAVGGDGTVNEVARCLVQTPVVLGVLPIGSGNGLARNLGIPVKLKLAMAVLKKFETRKIDIGQVNDLYFFCNLSIAFSAHVIHNYHAISGRGFLAYSKAFGKTLRHFKYDPVELLEQGVNYHATPFIFLISNTNQLGYNKTLTPNASLYDGKLDFIQVERSHFIAITLFMLCAFFKIFPPFFKVQRKQMTSMDIMPKRIPIKLQLDGEKLWWAEKEPLRVRVLPQSLNVICANPN